jgi:hypothetical protein
MLNTMTSGGSASTYVPQGWAGADGWVQDRATGAATVLGLLSEIQHFVEDYPDGWDGPDSLGPSLAGVESIRRALACYPSALPLPRTMLSSSGDLGLYWDFGSNGYADLSADQAGVLSFFSRNAGDRERFEELHDATLDSAWFWSRLGEFLNGYKAAA